VVVLDRLGNLAQVGGEPLAVKFPFQHFRETHFWGRSAGAAARPLRRIVDGEGGFVEVALELEAGLVDETLVFRIVADGGEVLARVRLAGGAEVEIEKRVGAGQQAGGLGRRVLAQLDGEGHRRGDHYDRHNDGEGAPNSHGMRSGKK
jgi:hypothetical protein